MLISLKQDEIETALQNYIGETAVGLDLSLYKIDTKLIAGRRGNGLRAEIELTAWDTLKSAPTDSENDASSLTAAAEPVENTDEKVVEEFDFDTE